MSEWPRSWPPVSSRSASRGQRPPRAPMPEVGVVYTINDVFVGRSGAHLTFAELHYESNLGRHWYEACQFCPVRDTSIESLRGLLSPTPDDARRYADELECL